jgi:hypothetical protein
MRMFLTGLFIIAGGKGNIDQEAIALVNDSPIFQKNVGSYEMVQILGHMCGRMVMK